MISLWLCFDIILYLLCIFVCMQWCYYTVRDVYILTYISPLGWCDSSRSCTLKSTVTQLLFFSDCTWSVSHSNSVHCLTIYSNFSEYNVLLWLAWFRKEYTFLLWFSYSCFLITYFKHIELWRMLVRGLHVLLSSACVFDKHYQRPFLDGSLLV